MRDPVLGRMVVMPDGDIIKTGGRARKSSASCDLTRLMFGSEGALGVNTELTLRLFGIPESFQTAMCGFATIEDGTLAVVSAQQCGLALSRIGPVDALQMRAINSHSQTNLPQQPTLWIKLTGSTATTEHDMAVLEERAETALRFERTQTAEAAARLWRLRHDAVCASRASRPGITGISTDVCVPISKLPACFSTILSVVGATDIQAHLLGHGGDGNFLLVLLYDPANEIEAKQTRHISSSLDTMATRMGRTYMEEHDVGLDKKACPPPEHCPALGVMRRIMRAFAPYYIMNPAKSSICSLKESQCQNLCAAA